MRSEVNEETLRAGMGSSYVKLVMEVSCPAGHSVKVSQLSAGDLLILDRNCLKLIVTLGLCLLVALVSS